jgi:hypothetical protein
MNENALPCSSAGSSSRAQVENLKANSLSVQPLFTSLEIGWTALLAHEEREKSVEATGTAVFGSTPRAFMQYTESFGSRRDDTLVLDRDLSRDPSP